MMTKQMLVTTGATVTFKKLIEFTLNTQFINLILKLHYSSLVVQYGNSQESTQLIRSILSAIKAANTEFKFDESTVNVFRAQFGSSQILDIECIQFDPNLVSNYTSKSDLVISHAGTGSILDTLRCHKKMIVLINEDLKDNHQLEIAEAFEKLNTLRYLKGDLQSF